MSDVCSQTVARENKLILGIIQETYFLTTLSEAGVMGLIEQMRRYPDVWPQECISELEGLSGKITEAEAQWESAIESLKEALPPFHYSYSWRLREYEERGKELIACVEELKSEIAGLRSQRKESLIHSGFYIDAKAYFYENQAD